LNVRWRGNTSNTRLGGGGKYQPPSLAVADLAIIGIVTSVTGLNPGDIYGVAYVTAADECLVTALKDHHMGAVFKVAGALGIGRGS